MPLLLFVSIIVLLLSTCVLVQAEEASLQTGLKIVLQQAEPEPGENGPILRIIAENRGGTKISIVRPMRWWFIAGNANGWTLTMKGPAGEYHSLVPPGPAPILAPNDVLDIRPNDGFSVRLNVGSWWHKSGTTISTPGEYTVQVRYESPKGVHFPIPQHEPVVSAELKIVQPAK